MGFLFLLSAFLSTAHAYNMPEFSGTPLAERTEAIPSPIQKITQFRVQVFPHLGTYAVPQGRESVVSSVKIASEIGCIPHAAVVDSNQDWLKGVATKGVPQTEFTLRAGRARITYFECAKPFTVTRGKNDVSYSYGGDFVAVVSSTQVRIINIVDSETYLKGVVPSEVSAAWPAELLKAQAVAARTYAWWSVIQSRATKNDFDLDDTVAYQAYLGMSHRAPSSDQVVDATSGQVLTYENKVIKAYFSADSGGFTESAHEVFGDLPYCQANPETYNLALYPATFWSASLTAAALRTSLVSSKLLPVNVASIHTLSVLDADRTASGRARKVTVTTSDGKKYAVDGVDFRLATKLRSNLFNVSAKGASFQFDGKGYGHGVGMAQIGALQYATQLNWNYEQILNFYYTGIQITHE